MFSFSSDPSFLVRTPRQRWMRLFPWLRLYFCTQSKTTRLSSRAKVDAARAEHIEQRPEKARCVGSKVCAQPLPEASSENKEISMPREKRIYAQSTRLPANGRQTAAPSVPSKQRYATRRIRASMQHGRHQGPGDRPYESGLPSAGAQLHLVVRVEVKSLSRRIARSMNGKQEHQIYF